MLTAVLTASFSGLALIVNHDSIMSATVINYAARLSWLGRGRLWRANANII
jgi:hypothetical protein